MRYNVVECRAERADEGSVRLGAMAWLGAIVGRQGRVLPGWTPVHFQSFRMMILAAGAGMSESKPQAAPRNQASNVWCRLFVSLRYSPNCI